MSGSIVVVPYDPTWPTTFERLRAELETTLTGVPVVSVEHVGSTSVPGLAAKPIIDIDIVVEPGHVAAATMALVAGGYEALGELGVSQRWAFREPPESTRHNTYVTVLGCLSLRNHLGLRDVLRADPGLRDEYGALKRQLAAELDDIDEYVVRKSAVVHKVLERAGLTATEIDEIKGWNTR